MSLELLQEKDLYGLGNPWPMKDAAAAWEAIKRLSFKKFNILVLAYLTNLGWTVRRGRPTELESLARDILFRMSEKQRAVAYRLINNKYEYAVSKGYWNDDVSSLIAQKNPLDINKETHRDTGFIRRILDKRKRIVDEDTTVRLKFVELESAIDKHKEWMLTYVETTNGDNLVSEYRYAKYEDALKDFNEMEL